ncbi:olfactory receptor 6C74-like [Terrapene carolina triunguis]|uniref:olfactory receptor 6C74-like n=1 Tax=Terrapene triunguis TaxID=2587831 RepID=UPI000CEFAA51|nr:olfactory receptor 6C74-like [Terrapene carolina triunguis]
MAGLEKGNHTRITVFLLVGFETFPEPQITLFVVFFIIYLATISGNLLLILTVWTDRHLHTPMYFFLSNLSFLETGYISNIIPRLLVSLLTGDKTISLSGCFLQLFVFSFLGATECFLMTGMSYDRYLAICDPLHYASNMSPRASFWLTFASWALGFVAPSFTIIMASMLPFCGPLEINHFFCDLTAVLKLPCTDTSLTEMAALISSSTILVIPFVLTIMSYVYVILTILRIPSTIGRKKAFFTCSSHLIVISTFYGALIIMYVVPSRNQSLDFNKVFSLLYTVVTPMLNPIVYSLRNQEVKDALSRSIAKMWSSTKM